MTRTGLVLALCAAAACALAAAGPLQAATQYAIADLGMLDGRYSYARAVNASAQAAGTAWTTGGARAFLYDGGMSSLGTLGGASSEGWGINDAAQVVGFAADGSGNERAFVYQQDTAQDPMMDLGTLTGSGDSRAYDINNSAQIAGYSISAAGEWHAFRADYDAGTGQWALNDIHDPLLGDTSSSNARGINALGHVVGWVKADPGSQEHAFLYDGVSMADLGGPAGWYHSEAYAVNDADLVVGTGRETSGGPVRAFVYDGSAVTSLGVLGSEDPGDRSYAFGVGGSGLIVGMSTSDAYNAEEGFYEEHAFACTGGVMYDLNDLLTDSTGWRFLVEAWDVNAGGQIVGWGYDEDWDMRAFLLTPTGGGTPPVPIPEPLTAWGVVLAAAALARYVRRRRSE